MRTKHLLTLVAGFALGALLAGVALADGSGSGSAAATADPSTINPTSAIQQLYLFMRTGHGTAAIGVSLTLVVWAARQWLSKVWAWWATPAGGYLLGFLLPALTFFGTALASGHGIDLPLLMNTLGAAWVAGGGWEHLRDLLTVLKIGTPPAPPAAPVLPESPVTPTPVRLPNA